MDEIRRNAVDFYLGRIINVPLISATRIVLDLNADVILAIETELFVAPVDIAEPVPVAGIFACISFNEAGLRIVAVDVPSGLELFIITVFCEPE